MHAADRRDSGGSWVDGLVGAEIKLCVIGVAVDGDTVVPGDLTKGKAQSPGARRHG